MGSTDTHGEYDEDLLGRLRALGDWNASMCRLETAKLQVKVRDQKERIERLEENIANMARVVKTMTLDHNAVQDRYESILRNPFKAVWFWLTVPKGSIPVD